MLTRWVGKSRNGPKYAYVILEWSPSFQQGVCASGSVQYCSINKEAVLEFPGDANWIRLFLTIGTYKSGELIWYYL